MNSIEQSIEVIRAFTVWNSRWPFVGPTAGADIAFIEALPLSQTEIPRAIEGGLLRVHFPTMGGWGPRLETKGFTVEGAPVPAEGELREEFAYVEIGNGNRAVQAPDGSEQKTFSVFTFGKLPFSEEVGWRANNHTASFKRFCELVLQVDRPVKWHVVKG